MKSSVLVFVAIFLVLVGGYLLYTSKMVSKPESIAPVVPVDEKDKESEEEFSFYQGGKNFDSKNYPSTKYNSATSYQDEVVGSYGFTFNHTSEQNSGSQIQSAVSKLPLSTLINKKGSYFCTWSHPGLASQISGSMFIHSNMVHFELKATNAQESQSVHMLARDGYIYTWNTLRADGVKNKISHSDPNPKIGFLENNDNAAQFPNYNCKTWTPNLSTFVIPAREFRFVK